MKILRATKPHSTQDNVIKGCFDFITPKYRAKMIQFLNLKQQIPFKIVYARFKVCVLTYNTRRLNETSYE